MNADRIIFEAPLHRNMEQLARGMGIGKDRLVNHLDSAGKLELVRNVFKWVRKDSVDHRRKSRVPDMTGMRFGNVVITGRAPNKIESNGKPSAAWFCKCDCGAEVVKRPAHLKRGVGTCCADCLRIKKYDVPAWQKKWRAA